MHEVGDEREEERKGLGEKERGKLTIMPFFMTSDYCPLFVFV